MQLMTLDEWPFAVSSIVGLAQKLADHRGHAMTSPAHVSHVLYAMKPVRKIVEGALTPAAVEAALMMEKKAGATRALLTPQLGALLFASTTARTTPAFLETYAAGHATAQRIGTAYATHAETIAAIVDQPSLQPIFKDPGSAEMRKRVPGLVIAFARAQAAKHAEVTTRHVVLGNLVVVDKLLQKNGLAGVEAQIAELTELIDRSTGKGATMFASPKLFGALAGVLADGTLETHLLAACLEDDDALAFAATAAREGIDRL